MSRRDGMNNWGGFYVDVVCGLLMYNQYINIFLGLLFVVIGTVFSRWLVYWKFNHE